MNRTIVPNGGPKLRLIEAAEKLFAERGFEAVSVRDITQAAGGNVAAVNYHFGSRDGLVAVVMTRYLAPVNEERLMRLEECERKWGDQPVPVEDVVDAFVRPLITQVEKSELSEQLFYRLVGRIFGSHGNGIPAEIEEQITILISRFIKALSKALPTVAEEDLVWRLHFVIGAMIYMLTHGEVMQRLSQGAAGAPDMEATLARFVRFAVAGLRDGVMIPQVGQVMARDEAGGALRGPLADDEAQEAEQVPDGGHRPPPQDADVEGVEVAVAKPAKKRSKKVEQDSPQVMFEF